MKSRRPAFRFTLRTFLAFFCLSTLILAAILLAQAFLVPPERVQPAIPAFPHENDSGDGQDASTTRQDGIYTALLLGKDNAGENTDVIMLAAFREEEDSISVLQIPRDTFVRYGGRGVKLGSLYARMLSAAEADEAKNPEKTALAQLTETVGGYFSIPIDFYLLLDLGALRDTVDAMGGVTVDVPCDMDYDDPAQSLSIHLKAGKQHLDGNEAVQLVRFRAGYITADIGRLDAQKLFLSALWQRAKEPAGFAGLTGYLPALLNRTKTNAGLSDALYFLGKMGGVRTERITFATVRGEALRAQSGAWYYVLNREGAREDISRTVSPLSAPLEDAVFDPDGVFTDPADPQIDQIYRKDASAFEQKTDSAAELIEGGADIPLLSQSP